MSGNKPKAGLNPPRVASSSDFWARRAAASVHNQENVTGKAVFGAPTQPVIPAKRPASSRMTSPNPPTQAFGTGLSSSEIFRSVAKSSQNVTAGTQSGAPTALKPATPSTWNGVSCSFASPVVASATNGIAAQTSLEASNGATTLNRSNDAPPAPQVNSQPGTAITEATQSSTSPASTSTTAISNGEAGDGVTRFGEVGSSATRLGFHGFGRSTQGVACALGGSTFAPASKRPALNLLEGPALEILVGPLASFPVSAATRTWFLPKALMQHFSPMLKEQCMTMDDKTEQKRIDLLGHNPKVFALFVEWMYYGYYTGAASPENVEGTVDAEAWVLGDKLKVIGFQNFAMDRLYWQHVGIFDKKPVTTEAMKFACAKTPVGSLLRRFYFHMLAQHIMNPGIVKGTTTEWDSVLQAHEEARTFLLDNWRKGSMVRAFVGPKEAYTVKPRT